jgi:hypothetical protein
MANMSKSNVSDFFDISCSTSPASSPPILTGGSPKRISVIENIVNWFISDFKKESKTNFYTRESLFNNFVNQKFINSSQKPYIGNLFAPSSQKQKSIKNLLLEKGFDLVSGPEVYVFLMGFL